MKVDKKSDRGIYEFARLDNYSFGERILIRLTDYILYLSIFIVGHTLRFEPMNGWDELELGTWDAFQDKNEKEFPVILAFWHDRIFLLVFLLRNIRGHVMISKSFDGEYIARTVQRLGYGVIRGSTSKRGAVSALASMIRLTKRGKRMGITVDGPRGPRHRSKLGAIVLARKTGLPVIPLIIEPKKRWVFKTWDKTHIPKPFSRVKVFWGEPIFVPADADEVEMEEKRTELDLKLDELVAIAKEWRVTKN